MSHTRLVIRVLLCLLIVAMGWFVIQAQLRNSPGRQIGRAERALESGDWQTARIHLLNALKENQDNGAAHKLMGEVYLAEAKSQNKPATYQTNYEARKHLSTAARLLPQDVALQKQLLGIFLDRGSTGAAVEIADKLVKFEPNDPDVLVALLAKAVSAENLQQGQQRLAQLKEHPTDRVYRAAALAVALYGNDVHADQRAKVLAEVVQQTGSLTAEQLTGMPQIEQLLMVDLLKRAILEAGDMNVAHERAEVALGVCDKISSSGQEVSQELAGFAADVVAVLSSRYPLTAQQDAKTRQTRSELISRAAKHLDKAIETKHANFAVYAEAARIAFEQNEHERVDQILSAALAAPPAEKSDKGDSGDAQKKMQLHLLAARNLFVMRRYSDTKPHLQALISSSEREFAGWGELLSGGVASAEGRHETALEHYLQAQRLLGRTPFVKIALAKTYVVLGRWRDAQPLLETAGTDIEAAEPTAQAWARLHQMFQQQVLWEQFRAHLALDEWEPAQEIVKKLAGTPNEVNGETLSVGYLAAHNQNEEALKRVVQAREKFPDDLTLRITHARLLVQAGQKEQARELIEQLTQSEDLPSQAFLAMWRTREKKYDEAVQILSALETRFPDNPTPTFLKARVLLVAGKSREALEIAKKLRESPQTAAAGNLLEMMQELREQDLAEASEKMKVLAEDAPSVTPGMNLLSGRLSAAQGNFGAAVQQVADSLDVTGLRQQARQTLLESLLQLTAQEGPQRAAEALAPLLEQYPEDAFLRVVEADLKFKQGQFDEGMAALNRVEQILGRKATPVYLKAAIWSQAGQVDRALEEIKRCLVIDEDYLPAHALAAQLYLATGKYQLSAGHAAKVLKRNPRSWELYLTSAEALHQLKKPQEAMRILQAAIKVEPKFLAAYRGIASLHLAASRPGDALETLREARQAVPESFVPVTDEIAILCQQKKLDEAEALAAKVVVEPQATGKCLAVSRTFAFSGHLDNAQKWAQKGLEVAKADEKAAAYRQLGELALAEGQKSGNRQSLEAARDHFSKVLEANPRDFIAGNNLAWLLATEFDQPQQALDVVRKVQGEATVEQMPVGFLDTLAVVYRRAGKLDEARDLLGQALKSYPDNPVLMYHLGMVLSDRGQKSAALNMLERAVDSGNLSDPQKDEATKTLQALSGKATTAPN